MAGLFICPPDLPGQGRGEGEGQGQGRPVSTSELLADRFANWVFFPSLWFLDKFFLKTQFLKKKKFIKKKKKKDGEDYDQASYTRTTNGQ